MNLDGKTLQKELNTYAWHNSIKLSIDWQHHLCMSACHQGLILIIPQTGPFNTILLWVASLSILFPFSIKKWDQLETDLRNEPDFTLFKIKLKEKLKPMKFKHYHVGFKYPNTLHTQLRLGRSFLTVWTLPLYPDAAADSGHCMTVFVYLSSIFVFVFCICILYLSLSLSLSVPFPPLFPVSVDPHHLFL